MIKKIASFLRDRAGSYAPLVALLALPIMGSVSASLEYSAVYQVHQNLQYALDAAALATAKELSASSDQDYLEIYAQNFFEGNLDEFIKPQEVGFDFNFGPGPTGGNRVTLTANYTYDTFMAGVIGVEEIPMKVIAVVAAANRTAEIAIVIDNSGSMDTGSGPNGETRMELARVSAAQLVTSLHTVSSFSNKPDPIRISVVPFAGSVNVGSKYRGADWLDMKGWSSVHHENLDWKGTTTKGDAWSGATASGSGWTASTTSTVSVGPNPPNPLPAGITSYTMNWLSRWTLMDAIGVKWGGCVEMRPGPYNATDDAPTPVTASTLFVPMFAPDEPDRKNTSEDNDYKNKYLGDYVRVGTDYAATTTNFGSNAKQHLRQDWTRKYNVDAKIKDSSNKVLIGQERTRDFGPYGPNQGCTTDAIQPLTTDPATAVTAIENMDPGGYTNVQSGLIWGWYTLSANAPFTEGRSYDIAENDKYIILMTDGNNTFPDQSTLNRTEYYAWGFGKDDRVKGGLVSATSNVDAMNQQTALTCANIKAVQDADNEAAIKIFTIVYDVPDGSTVKQLLYDCASASKTGQKYYYDVEGDGIAAAMASIGNEISQLRIAQ